VDSKSRYSGRKPPRIGVVFNAIGAFSPEGKERTERAFIAYLDRLRETGWIAEDSIIIGRRTFGPHEAAEACRRFAAARVDGIVWVASAFTNGNAFSTLAADPYLWRVPLLLVAEEEAEFAGGAEWTTNAWCGVIMNNFAARGIGRKVGTLPGAPGRGDFESGFSCFLRVAHAVSNMRADYMLRFGDAPAGFHSASADELRLTAVFGTRIDRLDVAAVLDTYKSGVAEGLLGKRTFTESDVAETVDRVMKTGPVLVDDETLASGVRLYHALRALIEAYGATSAAVKCWPELQSQNIFRWTPCLALGLLLSDGVVNAAACESDCHTAVAQSLGTLLSGAPAACLDFVDVTRSSDVLRLGHCGVGIPGMMAPNDESVPRGRVDEKTRQRIYSGEIKVGCAVCRSSPAGQGGFETGPNMVGQLAYGPKTGIGLAPEGDGFKMLVFTGENSPDTAKGILYAAADVVGPDTLRLHETIIREGFSHHLAVAFGDISEELKLLAHFAGIKVIAV